VGEVSRYADHEFRERLRVTDAPPLLSARVKADMMRRMLQPAAGQALIDLGCGPGKMALYAGAGGARAAGLDVAPFFLPRAREQVELVLGDLRRLPFRKGTFPGAFSLDVLEHLDEPDLPSSTRTRWNPARWHRCSARSSASRAGSDGAACWTTSGKRCARATTRTRSGPTRTSTRSAVKPGSR
jgi:SAM-dependent methyltransferase